MKEQDRLPPNQHLTEDFPVLHAGNIPAFDKATWDFKVKGLVENPITINYDEFLSLPSTTVTADFHCVTGWTKYGLLWHGVLFKSLASIVKPMAEAKFVIVVAEHGYTTNMPLETAMNDDVILAYEYDKKPITPAHGYPLRLVVPKLYAYKSAKWVRQIVFTAEDKKGFWEVRGYSNSADPWKEERYS
ncbi:MAG: sulfite oxidase-like oxidoreductase [Candidatus Magnetoovum sp. WYHC-5]|nr:sulfite oxidase-like oxidoreductase [Candidatus Magnetoovum sp. WYHC-5]